MLFWISFVATLTSDLVQEVVCQGYTIKYFTHFGHLKINFCHAVFGNCCHRGRQSLLVHFDSEFYAFSAVEFCCIWMDYVFVARFWHHVCNVPNIYWSRIWWCWQRHLRLFAAYVMVCCDVLAAVLLLPSLRRYGIDHIQLQSTAIWYIIFVIYFVCQQDIVTSILIAALAECEGLC